MDTKTYLQQISRLDRMINNKLSEIQQFRELARSVSAVKNEERVKTSPNFDKMGSTYCKIEKMEEELDDLIDNCLYAASFVKNKKYILALINNTNFFFQIIRGIIIISF